MIDPKYNLKDIVKFEVSNSFQPVGTGLGSISIEAEIFAAKKASNINWIEYWVATDDSRIVVGASWYNFSRSDAHDIPLYYSNNTYIVYPSEQDYQRFLNKKWCAILQPWIISANQIDINFSQSAKSDGANCEKCNEYIPFAFKGIICYRCKNEKKLFGYE